MESSFDEIESGIYMIRNNINNNYYIGSSINLNRRKNSHFSKLRKNKHVNKKLQNSYNKYGQKNFEWIILKPCDKDSLQKEEQKYLNLYFNDKNNLNLVKEAYSMNGKNHPMYNKHHTEETKKKIKMARQKQIIKHSEETKKKIGEGNRNKIMSKKSKQKISKSKKGSLSWNKGKKIKGKDRILFPEDVIINIIILYNKGYSIEYIRKLYNYSWDTIKKLLLNNNIKTYNISEQKRRKINEQFV